MTQHLVHNAHDAHDSGESHETHGSLKSYTIGFVMSLVLTAIPLIVVLNHMLEGRPAIWLLVGTAVLQFIVQLFYFMHLKEEKNPRYNLTVLLFGIVIVVMVVAGSMWIMMFNKVA